ncbi:MAG: SoxR reducing system RseC family protein [Spirochaetota bacterium]
MKETATVVAVHTDHVVLRCVSSGCTSCAGGASCNAKGKTFTASKPEDMHLKPGDTVDVYLHPGKTIASGFMILVFPLGMFLFGLFAIQYWVQGSGEGLQAIGGFSGLLAGFGIAYLFGRLKKRTHQPVVTSVHSTYPADISAQS